MPPWLKDILVAATVLLAALFNIDDD